MMFTWFRFGISEDRHAYVIGSSYLLNYYHAKVIIRA